MIRLAFIVSHPIQYYAPLYRRLAQRDDIVIKVFYTWHGGQVAQFDAGFKKEIAWDIPLTAGYDHETVPNTARDPGSHQFWGLQNPGLVASVLAWRPDAVHLTGYAYASHLKALRSLSRRGVPVLFRGDSTLLDGQGSPWRWRIKKALLSIIYSWPAAFLDVGEANREYYRAFGVPVAKLHHCPHSIEVDRFAQPDEELEKEAADWRASLNLAPDARVLLFAGKFEDKKRPVPLIKAFLRTPQPLVLVMVGNGALEVEIAELAAAHPERFRLLPFQNQKRMPVVYRLGDALVLPSAYGETWGLAVNEALACGRPVLVSDRVGCQADVLANRQVGSVFRADDWDDFGVKLGGFNFVAENTRREEIKAWSRNWSIETTESSLVAALCAVLPACGNFRDP